MAITIKDHNRLHEGVAHVALAGAARGGIHVLDRGTAEARRGLRDGEMGHGGAAPKRGWVMQQPYRRKEPIASPTMVETPERQKQPDPQPDADIHVERKMIAIAQVIDQPKLVAQGILAGHYAWKYSMSMLVTYWLPPYDDKSKFPNPLTVDVIVERQPILQSDHGLGIIQSIATFLSNSNSAQPQEISSTPTG